MRARVTITADQLLSREALVLSLFLALLNPRTFMNSEVDQGMSDRQLVLETITQFRL